MTYPEYENIQNDLSRHLDRIMRFGKYQMTRKERDAYERAILAAKSVLSNYNPERKQK